MMVNYYKTKCEEYKTNTKRLWEVLNRVVGKSKNAEISISHLTVDGIKSLIKRLLPTNLADSMPIWERTWQAKYLQEI